MCQSKQEFWTMIPEVTVLRPGKDRIICLGHYVEQLEEQISRTKELLEKMGWLLAVMPADFEERARYEELRKLYGQLRDTNFMWLDPIKPKEK